MTYDEARLEVTRLAAEHPDQRFSARERDGEWEVIKVRLPAPLTRGPLKTTTEAKPKPPAPDDPRTSYDKNVGGPWVG